MTIYYCSWWYPLKARSFLFQVRKESLSIYILYQLGSSTRKIAQFHQDHTRFVRIKLFTFLNCIFLPKKVMNGLLRYGVQLKCIEACGWTCLLNKETDVSQNHFKTKIQITCPQLGNEKWIAQQKKNIQNEFDEIFRILLCFFLLHMHLSVFHP